MIGDEKTLFPDVAGDARGGAACWCKEGFIVLPYVTDDPIACKRLEDIGCAAVMPLAAPIGSGLGIRNPLQPARSSSSSAAVPVIVDAGVGTASDAALALELGCDAVLMNTAIAGAQRSRADGAGDAARRRGRPARRASPAASRASSTPPRRARSTG